MAIGVVSEIARTSKGAPYIVVNGARLYASQCETPPTGLTVGMKIDYEATPFGDTGANGKRPLGLKRWKPILDSQGSPQIGSTITDGDILRSVSNIVGNAAAAGKIESPMDLAGWVGAAYLAFTNMGKAQAPRSGEASGSAPKDEDPGFDDLDKMPPW